MKGTAIRLFEFGVNEMKGAVSGIDAVQPPESQLRLLRHAVGGVGEVDGAGGADDDVVGAVEPP